MGDTRLIKYKDEFVRKVIHDFYEKLHSDKKESYTVHATKVGIQGVVGCVPEIGAALSAVVEFGFDFYQWVSDRKKSKNPTHFKKEGYKYKDDALGIQMDIVAMEAARRYQYLILQNLGDDNATIPFAEAGAMQVLAYCEDKKLPIISCAIDGLLLGKSVREPIKVNPVPKIVSGVKMVLGTAGCTAGSAYRHALLMDEQGKLYKTHKTNLEEGNPKYGYVQLSKTVIDFIYKGKAILYDKAELGKGFQEKLKQYSPSWVSVDKHCLRSFYNRNKVERISWIDYVRREYFPDYHEITLVFYMVADAEDLDLTGYNFEGFDLSQGVFNHCRFGKSLVGTKFNGSYLRNADFGLVTDASDSEFKKAHIEFIKANGKNFTGSDFLQTHCYYGQFEGADFDVKNRDLAVGLETANLQGIKSTGLRGDEVRRFLENFYKFDSKIIGIVGPEFNMDNISNYVDLQMEIDKKENQASVDRDGFMTCSDEIYGSEFRSEYEPKQAIGIDPQALFEPGEDAAVPSLVYIHGQTGTGKTTVVRLLAYYWTQGLWPEIKYLFVLNCRSLTSGYFLDRKNESFDLAKWLYYHPYKPHGRVKAAGISFSSEGFNYDNFKEFIDKIMSRESDKVMIIVDGMDEVPSSHCCERVMDKLKGGEFGNCRLIFTSRYKAGADITRSKRNVKLMGFNHQGIAEYIHYYFGKKGAPVSLHNVTKFGVLSKIAHIPVVLNMLCGIFESGGGAEGGFDLNDVDDISKIYHIIEPELLLRHVERCGIPLAGLSVTRKIETVRKMYEVHCQVLEELAYQGFKEKMIFMPKQMLLELIDKAVEKGDIENKRESIQAFTEEVLKLGFTRNLENGDIEFFHLSFQERFAALYAAKNMQIEEVNDFIAGALLSPRYLVFFWFYMDAIKENKMALESVLKQFIEAGEYIGPLMVSWVLADCLERAMPIGSRGNDPAPLIGIDAEIQKSIFTLLENVLGSHGRIEDLESMGVMNQQVFLEMEQFIGDYDSLYFSMPKSPKLAEYLYTGKNNFFRKILSNKDKEVMDVDKALSIISEMTELPEKFPISPLGVMRCLMVIRLIQENNFSIYCDSIFQVFFADLESDDFLIRNSALLFLSAANIKYASLELFRRMLDAFIIFQKDIERFPEEMAKEFKNTRVYGWEEGVYQTYRSAFESDIFYQFMQEELNHKSLERKMAVICSFEMIMSRVPADMRSDIIGLVLKNHSPGVRDLGVRMVVGHNSGHMLPKNFLEVMTKYKYLDNEALKGEILDMFKFSITAELSVSDLEILLSELVNRLNEDNKKYFSKILSIIDIIVDELGEEYLVVEIIEKIISVQFKKTVSSTIIRFIAVHGNLFIHKIDEIESYIVRNLREGKYNTSVIEQIAGLPEYYLTQDMLAEILKIVRNKDGKNEERLAALDVLARLKVDATELIREAQDIGEMEEGKVLKFLINMNSYYISRDVVAYIFKYWCSNNKAFRSLASRFFENRFSREKGSLSRSLIVEPGLTAGILNNIKRQEGGGLLRWLEVLASYVDYCKVKLTDEMLKELINIQMSASDAYREGVDCRHKAIFITGKVGRMKLFSKGLERDLGYALGKNLEDPDDSIRWHAFEALGKFGKAWLKQYMDKLSQLFSWVVEPNILPDLYNVDDALNYVLDLGDEALIDAFSTCMLSRLEKIEAKTKDKKIDSSWNSRYMKVWKVVEKMGDRAINLNILKHLVELLDLGMLTSNNYSIVRNLHDTPIARYVKDIIRGTDKLVSILELEDLKFKAMVLYIFLTQWLRIDFFISILKEKNIDNFTLSVTELGNNKPEVYSIPERLIPGLRHLFAESRSLLGRNPSTDGWQEFVALCQKHLPNSTHLKALVEEQQEDGAQAFPKISS